MKPSLRTVIGIDPGTCVTGYGVIAAENNKYKALDFGCIRPPAALKLSDRYLIIYKGICKLLDDFSPEAVAVETQYVDKNVQSAIKLGMVRGVVIIAAKTRSLPVYEYAPTKAKQAVVGNGRATKQQVQGMTQQLLSLVECPHPEDAADALAIALCHLFNTNGILNTQQEV